MDQDQGERGNYSQQLFREYALASVFMLQKGQSILVQSTKRLPSSSGPCCLETALIANPF